MGVYSGASYPLRIVFVGFLSLMIFGCGKKTPPKPIEQPPPPQVNDLQGRVHAEKVQLTWTIPEQMKGEKASYCFSIRKSQLAWKDRSCPTCPPLSQKELKCISPAHPSPAILKEGTMTWVDGNVSPYQAYRYQIVIQNDKGQSVSSSNPVLVKVLTPPAAPESLKAVPDNQGILLQWKPPKKDKAGKPFKEKVEFQIERRTSEKDWEKISPVPIADPSFLDSSVAGKKTYDYRVTSVFSFEDSPILGDSSEIMQVKSPETIHLPPPPHTVWIVPTGGGLEIRWAEVDTPVKGYHVYRREGKEITRLTADPVQHSPFTDKQARKNTIYFYAVSSVSFDPPHDEGLVSNWVEIKHHSLN